MDMMKPIAVILIMIGFALAYEVGQLPGLFTGLFGGFLLTKCFEER